MLRRAERSARNLSSRKELVRVRRKASLTPSNWRRPRARTFSERARTSTYALSYLAQGAAALKEIDASRRKPRKAEQKSRNRRSLKSLGVIRGSNSWETGFGFEFFRHAKLAFDIASAEASGRLGARGFSRGSRSGPPSFGRSRRWRSRRPCGPRWRSSFFLGGFRCPNHRAQVPTRNFQEPFGGCRLASFWTHEVSTLKSPSSQCPESGPPGADRGGSGGGGPQDHLLPGGAGETYGAAQGGGGEQPPRPAGKKRKTHGIFSSFIKFFQSSLSLVFSSLFSLLKIRRQAASWSCKRRGGAASARRGPVSPFVLRADAERQEVTEYQLRREQEQFMQHEAGLALRPTPHDSERLGAERPRPCASATRSSWRRR